MHRRTFLALMGAPALGGLALAQDEGFTALYNGKDLSGWHAKDGRLAVWNANGELISCSGGGGGWLTTDREYGDFELRVDYRIAPGGNSGVGIRYPAKGDPAHAGMEIQILDDNAPDYRNLQAAQYTGGIYYQVPPNAKPAKPPGQWNRYIIRCEGPRIRIRLNDVEIQNVNVEQQTKGEGGHLPLSERPRRGFIGLQSHTGPADFRNIEIREL
jgi:hypothetical protein